jgi:hypothetical protein
MGWAAGVLGRLTALIGIIGAGRKCPVPGCQVRFCPTERWGARAGVEAPPPP